MGFQEEPDFTMESFFLTMISCQVLMPTLKSLSFAFADLALMFTKYEKIFKFSIKTYHFRSLHT